MAVHQLKAIVVGCGGMSRAWLDTATQLPDLQVVGLVDLNRQAAEEKATQFNLDQSVVFESLDEALDKAKPDIVFDVTIPDAHDKVTIQALEAGCHVLGEKPMAVSLKRAQKMVKAAEKAGKLYAVIQNRRYEPNIQRVRELLDSGRLGRIEEVHCDFYIGAHFGGFRDEMDYPLILDMAIHTFDAARYISRSDPQSVYCHSFNPPRSWYKGDASAVAIFEMAGDIVYSYRGSWCAEGVNTSWNSQWRVVCSNGSLAWDGENGITARAKKEGGEHGFMSEMEDLAVPEREVPHQGHAGLIREFVSCIQDGQTPQTVCTDNIKSLAMVLASVESAKQGKKIKVEW